MGRVGAEPDRVTLGQMRLDAVEVARFERGESENRTFWARIGGRPALRGCRVLEVGCGLGSLCVEVAQAGATKVVGLDSDAKVVEFARRHVARAFPHLAGIVEFHDLDPRDYTGHTFDCIVAKDSFEHILNLEGVLQEMKRLLVQGGRVYAGFGPLYNSPFGHHGRIPTRFPWRRFPWGHLLEGEAALVARANRVRAEGGHVFCYTEGPLTSIRDMGLNMYSLGDYRKALFGSGLKVVGFRVNQSANPISSVLSLLRRVPFLEEYCTHNVYCVLEKAA